MRHMNGEGESDWGPEKLDDVLVGMIERAARKKFRYPSTFVTWSNQVRSEQAPFAKISRYWGDYQRAECISLHRFHTKSLKNRHHRPVVSTLRSFG